MSVTAAQILVAIDADTKGVQKGLGEVNNQVKGAGSIFSQALGTFFGMGALQLAQQGLGMVKDVLLDSIDAAADSERVMSQTNAVIKSTGGIAGQSAQSVADLASKYQLLTGVDDEAIQGAENMLLTFTNIRGQAFEPTTQAVLDMATAMNGGATPSAEQLRQTAIQVGKALNDPVQGVTALQRVGVKLSAQQLEQVKHFMAVGDAASAQKVILGELNKEFGGSAAAAGDTYAGKMALVKGELQNVQEAIGGALLPVLKDLLTNLAPIITQFAKDLPGAIDSVKSQVAPFVQKLGELAGNLRDNKPLMDGIKNAFKELQPLIGPVLIGLGVLTAISFAPLAILIAVVAAIVIGLKKLWEVSEPVRSAIGNIVGAIAGFIGETGGKIIGFLTGLPTLFQTKIAEVKQRVQDGINAVLGVFQWLYEHNTFIKAMVDGIHTQIENLKKLIQAGVDFVRSQFDRAKEFAGIVGKAIGNVVSAVRAKFAEIQKAAGDLAGKLLEPIGQLKDKLLSLGGELIGKLADGVRNAGGKLKDALVGILKDALGALGFHDIHLPGFASGGVMDKSGLAIVGEHGPEVVALPGGSRVYNTQESMAMLTPRPNASASSSSGNTVVYLQLDGKTIARSVIPHIPGEVRLATGKRV